MSDKPDEPVVEGGAPAEEEEEEEFTVEKVVDSRMRGGKKEYLLKWKGYPDSENTWEPSENLDCPDMIAVFEDKKKKKESEKGVKRKATNSAKDDVKEKKKKKDGGFLHALFFKMIRDIHLKSSFLYFVLKTFKIKILSSALTQTYTFDWIQHFKISNLNF